MSWLSCWSGSRLRWVAELDRNDFSLSGFSSSSGSARMSRMVGMSCEWVLFVGGSVDDDEIGDEWFEWLLLLLLLSSLRTEDRNEMV